MPDFTTELSSKAGLGRDQVLQGVGAMLGMLKSRLDPEAFSHLKNAIPDSGDMLSAFEQKMQSAGGGLMDAIKNVAGKLLSGQQDATAAVHSHFANAGLTPEHLKNFLPKLHDMLSGKVPPGVIEQMKKHLPGFGQSAEQPVAANELFPEEEGEQQ
jgi:hypothetical protein